jgi:hypothetical protein
MASLPSQRSCIELQVEGPSCFSVRPFDKKFLKCRAVIHPRASEESTILEEHIVVECGTFRWIFPVVFTKTLAVPRLIELAGPSHQLLRHRVTLAQLGTVKNWEVSDLPCARKIINLVFLGANDLYVEAIVNRPLDYEGFITFFEEDHSRAERYPLSLRVGGRQSNQVVIEANVGATGAVKMKIKNGTGKFKVEFKNNKKKEFRVWPLEGEFREGQDVLEFEYRPVEYNGSKKAEVSVLTENGNFDFSLLGRFPRRPHDI